MSGERIAAEVAGHPIRMSDVEARASVLRHGPAVRHAEPAGADADDWIRRWAVRQLVGEAVLEHEMRAAAESPDAEGPEAAVLRLVTRITQGIGVSEQDVRSFYERNIDRYRLPERRRLRFVACSSHAEAVRALEGPPASRLDAASTMELRRGEYIGAFEEVVFASRVGEVVGPTLTEHGWIVARVEAITSESTVPYADARPAIAAELMEVARARAFDDWLELRRRELARVVPTLEHPADPLHGQPRHRH